MSEMRINNIDLLVKDIINKSDEFAFKKISFSNSPELWIESNIPSIKNKSLIELSDEKLKIYINGNKPKYLSYKEKRINFKTKPLNGIEIKPEKRYSVCFECWASDLKQVKLYIIGYNDSIKIQEEIIYPNKEKEIIFDPRCNAYRVAIRLTGEGIFELNNLELKPKFEDIIENKNIVFSEMNSCKEIKKVSDIKMAVIMDTFSYENFSKECNVFNITPDNYKDIILKHNIDIMFIESAWKGKDGSWEYKIAKYANQDKSRLKELINFCKSRNIKTIFWNKEDPIHFERFIDTAKLCDYIFTTDRNKVDDYKNIVKHERVYSLPFAAQPKLHNPIEKYDRKNGIVFAGSYYGNRHEDRKKDMEDILRACKNYNLTIYDRNYQDTINNPESPFRYPNEFFDNVVGSLDYSDIDKAYKGYTVMLNVNSVKYSPTMFSRRVFEGMACGTPVISTYSKGVDNYFGDIVIMDESNNKLAKKLINVMNNPYELKKKSVIGIREVLSKHTYENRMIYILDKVGIKINDSKPKVSMISIANSKSDLKKIIDIYENMEYMNKEIIILADNLFDGYIDCINKYNKKDIKVFINNYVERNYKEISELCKGEYIAFINKENTYGKNYLKDLILGYKYANADILGKASYYKIVKNKEKFINEGNEYKYVNRLLLDRSIAKKSVFRQISLKDSLDYLKGNKESIELFNIGIRLFSADSFNFIEGKDVDSINSKVFL
ncbi:glycosyltransferase [Clostridium baratii]|uniref:CgeB family protein n=1 Tax=Clostridium baratii TaxID=1561 RepID=UPI00290FD042|nr:glycosyltransferase [Clostridium baratii]MDU4912105.1 glycosyltransferase [Clostridium baratii]